MILNLTNATSANEILTWEVPYPSYKIKTIRFESTQGMYYLVACYNEDVHQLVVRAELVEGDADIVYTTTSFTVSFCQGLNHAAYPLSNITQLEIELTEVS